MFRKNDQLITAIQQNNNEAVIKLLDEGVRPDGYYTGPYPLIEALKKNNIDIIKLLLSKSACPTLDFYEQAKKSVLFNDIKKAIINYDCDMQSWIINKIKIFDPTFSNICCNGYAFMSVNTILSEEIDFFSERMKYIYETDDQTFFNDIEQLKHGSSSNAKIDNYDLLISIKPFFDGIKLTYQPAICNYLMDEKISAKLEAHDNKQLYQQVQPFIKFATSKKVEDQGGIYLSCRFTGIYKESELENYLYLFRQQIKNINKPIAILLRNHNHAITLSWNNHSNTWILIDINQIPVIKYMKIDNEMSKKLIANLVGEKPLPCVTEVYCLGNHSKLINDAMITWLKQPAMIKMHSLSNERLKLRGTEDISWFDISHLSGDPHLVRSIVGSYGHDQYLINKKTACGTGLVAIFIASYLFISNQKKLTSFINPVIDMFIFSFLLITIGSLMAYDNYKTNTKTKYAKSLSDFNSQFIHYAYSENAKDKKYKPISIFDGSEIIDTNDNHKSNINVIVKPKIL